jgi:hypothetical protein
MRASGNRMLQNLKTDCREVSVSLRSWAITRLRTGVSSSSRRHGVNKGHDDTHWKRFRLYGAAMAATLILGKPASLLSYNAFK